MSAPTPEALLDALAAWRTFRTEWPPKGHPDNPFDLMLPRWMVDKIQKDKGMSAQEYADSIYQVATKVIIVEPLS